MWVKIMVKLMLLLCCFVWSSYSVDIGEEKFNETELSSKLPNIWEDEVVTRMIRDILIQDVMKSNEHKRMKRQHKRDIYSTVSPIGTSKAQTTRKASATTQKTKKPSKVAQTGNKTKNRVTTSPPSTTKATVKPSTKPIVTNLGSDSIDSSKVKVRLRKVVFDIDSKFKFSFACQKHFISSRLVLLLLELFVMRSTILF